MGSSPEEVMADKAIKIVGRGRPHIHLVIDDLRNRPDSIANFTGDGCRLLQRGPFGHINDDLKFTLVVKGQNFYADNLECEKRERRQKQNYHKEEKSVAPEGRMDKRCH